MAKAGCSPEGCKTQFGSRRIGDDRTMQATAIQKIRRRALNVSAIPAAPGGFAHLVRRRRGKPMSSTDALLGLRNVVNHLRRRTREIL